MKAPSADFCRTVLFVCACYHKMSSLGDNLFFSDEKIIFSSLRLMCKDNNMQCAFGALSIKNTQIHTETHIQSSTKVL